MTDRTPRPSTESVVAARAALLKTLDGAPRHKSRQHRYLGGKERECVQCGVIWPCATEDVFIRAKALVDATLPGVPDRPQFIDVVFDGPPGPVAGRFVECEGPDGTRLNAGKWIEEPETGWWRLRIGVRPDIGEAVERARQQIEAIALDLNTPQVGPSRMQKLPTYVAELDAVARDLQNLRAL